MARERSKNREEDQAIEPRHRSISRMEPWPFGSFSMMRRLSDEMDRMFDRMFEGYGLPGTEGLSGWGISERFSPKIDVFEREGKLVVTADLPGLSKDDVKVDVTEDSILIEGERKYEYEKREEGVYRSERSYGHFSRQIPLPEGVKADTATANFKNGVLEISLEAPQLSKARRRIQIQGEESGQKAA